MPNWTPSFILYGAVMRLVPFPVPTYVDGAKKACMNTTVPLSFPHPFVSFVAISFSTSMYSFFMPPWMLSKVFRWVRRRSLPISVDMNVQGCPWVSV